jgi:hypothetical protein
MAVLAAVLITSCARLPTGPGVLVLPGTGKTLEQFNADDGACRQWAAQQIHKTTSGDVPAQRRYDIAYVQCMYDKGHQIPALGQPLRRTSSAMLPRPQ